MRGRFKDLQPVDDEILAEDGNRDRGARGFKIVQGTLEVLFIGQNRKACRSAFFIGMGNEGGVEIRLEQAFTRRRLLNFSND